MICYFCENAGKTVYHHYKGKHRAFHPRCYTQARNLAGDKYSVQADEEMIQVYIPKEVRDSSAFGCICRAGALEVDCPFFLPEDIVRTYAHSRPSC